MTLNCRPLSPAVSDTKPRTRRLREAAIEGRPMGKRTQKYYAILEIAFDLDPNPMYLEYAVKELSNHNQFQC